MESFGSKFYCAEEKEWFWGWFFGWSITGIHGDTIEQTIGKIRESEKGLPKPIIVWQSNNVKEPKKPWNVVLTIWKYYFIIITCIAMGYWIAVHLHK